jgi:hypothetical protein
LTAVMVPCLQALGRFDSGFTRLFDTSMELWMF